jgi:nucleotide-binding universal stress UspA family protein
MKNSPANRVLVATSGSGSSRSAIIHAADEAASRGAVLEIIHVVSPTQVDEPVDASRSIRARRAGRELLVTGEQLARHVAPDLHVTTTLMAGARVDSILHRAADVDLLVVGAAPHDGAARTADESAVLTIVARATCPVVVTSSGTGTATRRVLLGVKSARHADVLLATAFAVAARTRSELRVVHASNREWSYDETTPERISPMEGDEVRAVERALSELRPMWPGVSVRVEVVHEPPALALLSGSQDADLLVISRPVHGGWVHHLGATARAAIRESACPVLVVPPTREAIETRTTQDSTVSAS